MISEGCRIYIYIANNSITCKHNKKKEIEWNEYTGKPDEEKTILKNTKKPSGGSEMFSVRNEEYFSRKRRDA